MPPAVLKRIVNEPGRDALNAGNVTRPLAFVRPDPMRTKVVAFARVCRVELISTLMTVLAGKPPTIGATGLPIGTLTVGAVSVVVVTGALTGTTALFAASASVSKPTPDGALAITTFK